MILITLARTASIAYYWVMATRSKKTLPTVEEIVEDAGGKKAVIAKLGIIRQAVEQWNKIPPTRVLEIEAMCKKYDRFDMRPDVFGRRPVKKRAGKAA